MEEMMMEEIKILSTVGGVVDELVNPFVLELGTCANCCQPICNNLDEVKVNPFHNKILESLSSLYKLNYLSILLGEEESIWSGNSSSSSRSLVLDVKLCDNCLQVFEALYKLYDEFNQLRSIESLLTKEIQKLDECLLMCMKAQQHCQTINVKSEQNIEQTQKNTKTRPNRNITKKKKKKTTEINKTSQKNKKSRLKRKEQPLTTTTLPISGSDPLVLVRRLEDDPIAQAALSKTQSMREKKETTNDNIEVKPDVKETNMNHDSFPPSPTPEEEENDSDFVPLEKEIDDDIDEDINESGDDADWKAPHSIKQKKQSPVKLGKKNNKIKKQEKKIDHDDEHDDDDEGSDEKVKEQLPKRKGRLVSHENMYAEFAYRRRKLTSRNPCWHCELDFETQAECFQHTKSVHFQPGNFICKACSRVLPKKVSYTCHLRKCKTLKPGELLTDYPCQKCGKIFPLQHQLKSHLRKHFEPDHLTCSYPGCDFQTKYTTSLKSHIIYKHEKPDEETICDVCGRVFKAQYLLKAHYYRLHSQEHVEKYREWLKGLLERKKEKRRLKAGDRPTFCDICNVDMITRNGLLHHKRTFHGEMDDPSDVVCELCGKGFAKGKLKRHIDTVHCETRNHVCSECPKTFKTSSMLGDHFRRTHTEEGRLRYNAKVRAQNQRRKMRQSALAQTVFSTTSTTTITVNPNDLVNDSIPQTSATLLTVINPQSTLNNTSIDHYVSNNNESSNIFIIQSHD